MKLEGAGWVIQIKAHHYNNAADLRSLGLNGGTYVNNTFLSQLENGRVMLPIPKEYQEQFGISKPGVTFSMQKLGIRYPVLTANPSVDLSYGILNPDHPSYRGAGGSGASGFDLWVAVPVLVQVALWAQWVVALEGMPEVKKQKLRMNLSFSPLHDTTLRFNLHGNLSAFSNV